MNANVLCELCLSSARKVWCMYVHVCFFLSAPSSDVTAPAAVCLSMEKVYDSATGLPRPDVLKDHFINEGRLEEDVALAIIREGVCVCVCVCVFVQWPC